MRRERHHSAGGVVVHEGRVLLIATRGGRRWQLPKGHVEPGESVAQAAVRETREETGVLGRVVAALPPVEYVFVEKGRHIRKRVDYFLLEYECGDTADFDASEVSGAAWFTLDEGLARLTFDNERRVVRAAIDLVGLPPATGATGA